MRRLHLILALLVCGLAALAAAADEFKLTNGETVVGEALPASADDRGMQIKIGEGNYQRVPWASFSQDDLKQFAKNPKLEQFVDAFIEITQAEKIKKTDVNLKQPPRFERLAKQSLFGALFSSGIGVFLVLVIYGANIYAGYEVAIYRAQSPPLVAGLSAVPILGLAAPIAFLAMRTRMTAGAAAEAAPLEPPAGTAAAAEAAAKAETVNPMLAAGAQHPASLKLADSDPELSGPAIPKTQVFQRGQFTFNRRFIETKFPGFFGVVRREADRDLLLVIKSARGEYTAERISRIAANDMHIQVHHGHASEEIMVPFQEIQQITLKHKSAP